MGIIEPVLSKPVIYRLWQWPFERKKIRPFCERVRVDSSTKVLDVGCGPGTNAPLFQTCHYTGIDLNGSYIASAQERYKGTFIAADATTFKQGPPEGYDVILINSLMHHLDDEQVTRLLHNLASLLSEQGRIHVLDLVTAPGHPLASLLVRLDRGSFARPESRWLEFLTRDFETQRTFLFPLGLGPLMLWQMLYFEGKRKSVE